MPSEPVVIDWNTVEADAFMALEWPLHNAAVGIHWDERWVVLACNVDGEVMGAARGKIVGGVGELKQLLVKKDRTGRGIGSRLPEAFERRCIAAGCHKVRLETGAYQARPFYERFGFTLAATLANDRFGRDTYVMEKRLPQDRPPR